MTLLDIAQGMRGRLRDGYSAKSAGVTAEGGAVEYGTAVGDSLNGYVTVMMDGAPTDAADYPAAYQFEVETDAPVANGARIGYVRQDGYGKAVALETLSTIAEGADAIATATNQHFWADANGAHVSTDADDPAGTQNIIMNSNGVLMREGASNLAAFTPSAVAFYDGQGNDASNITAQFGAAGAQIGSADSSKMTLTDSGFVLTDVSNAVTTEIGRSSSAMSDTVVTSVLVPLPNDGSVGMTLTGIASGSSFTVGVYNSSSGTFAGTPATFTQGTSATKTVLYSGTGTSWQFSVAYNGASELTLTMVSGDMGIPLWAVYSTSTVYPPYFTFGTRTGSAGAFSAVIGRSLKAQSESSLACGKFNVQADYPFIVGTGTSDGDRFNGFCVTRYGAAAIASSNITSGTVPASDTTGEAVVVFRDSAGTNIGMLAPRFIHDGGYQTMQFYANRNIGGTDYYNMLRLGIDGSGNRSVAISEVAPWLSALHVGSATLRNGGGSISTTSTYTVPTRFTSSYLVSSNSDLFTHSGTSGSYPYGIKCLVAGYVEVSGGYYVASLVDPGTSSSGAAVEILVNGTVYGEFVAPYSATNRFATVTFPPRVISVSANAVVQLSVKTTTTGTIATSRCFLTVRYVG